MNGPTGFDATSDLTVIRTQQVSGIGTRWRWYRGSARMGFEPTHFGEPLWKKILSALPRSLSVFPISI